eukprot:CAMPEP_0174283072 /NCGR_PEP_ID=MMETSP0809-20121228/3676_1 /TAXON_ID=73025 ORGANISM="Eutreptiella gymnastica-like, Strain CCMP1594" /NCGR_SAMPLE_ID=MMETSP0809 /ASSEMBLY_ACC=CAM_ASM_000658 /LENGTH=69 /DNA_ID=CAMNT_0015377719 /DNA_START=474 /DNA_END=680 /DNA_ORIENTATION=+
MTSGRLEKRADGPLVRMHAHCTSTGHNGSKWDSNVNIDLEVDSTAQPYETTPASPFYCQTVSGSHCWSW